MEYITDLILKGQINIDDITSEEFLKDRKTFLTRYKAQCPGFEAHHIIPISTQIKNYNEKYGTSFSSRKDFEKAVGGVKGGFLDDRCYRLTYFEHVVIHYLLAKENKTDSVIFSNMFHVNFSKIKDQNEKEKIESLKNLSLLRSNAKEKLKDRKLSEETRRKISESRKKIIVDEEWRRHISEGNKGHIVTEETRRKISEKNKNWVIPEEQKLKISNTLKLYYANLSDEERANLSKKRGEACTTRGKPLSEEHKKKISKSKKGKLSSEETKKKLSNSLKGRSCPNKGKVRIYRYLEDGTREHCYILKEEALPEGWSYGTGLPAHNRGKNHSSETIEKMKKAWQNRRRIKKSTF